MEIGSEAEHCAAVIEPDASEGAVGGERVAMLASALAQAEVDDAVAGLGAAGLAGITWGARHVTLPRPEQ